MTKKLLQGNRLLKCPDIIIAHSKMLANDYDIKITHHY